MDSPATPIPVPPTPSIPRRNVALYLILTLVTCGLFGIFWFCTLNDETNLVSNHPDAPNGIVALLLTIITCGIYGLFWMYAMGERIDEAKTAAGIPSSGSGPLYLVLSILGLGLIVHAILQSELNRFAA